MAIYTDGSKTDTRAAYSIFVPSVSVCMVTKCNARHSPYFIELLAVARALFWILTNSSLSSKFIILCDCLSAIESLGRYKPSDHPIIDEISETLGRIRSRGISVILIWVPGHIGVPGNERADSLAHEAATTPGPALVDRPLSMSESKSELRKHCYHIWNMEYQDSEKGSSYRRLFQSIYEKSLQMSSRRHETIIFRLRSGHCRLRAHLFKIRCSDSPLCEFCTTPETVDHFLLECPAYNQHRTYLRTAAAERNLAFSLQSILCDPLLLAHTVEFVISCNKAV